MNGGGGTTVFSAVAEGLVADGATDGYPAIRRAYDKAVAAGGGVVKLPPGVVALSQSFEMTDSAVVIGGAGVEADLFQGAPTKGTIVKWTGSAGGTMFKIYTPDSASVGVDGCGLVNMTILGNDSAAYGARVLSTCGGIYDFLCFRDCTTSCLDIGMSGTRTEDPQWNTFGFILVLQRTGTSASGKGITLNGNANGNASFNVFRDLHLNHKNGTAVEVGDSDSNVFLNIRINRQASGTAVGVDILGNSTTEVARTNVFVQVAPGAGGLTARGTSSFTNPSLRNRVLFYNQENGEPDPTIETGASLYWTASHAFSSTGESSGFTAGGGTTVTHTSTFTGNYGTKAYTLSDLVKACKRAGIVAAS